MFTDAKVNHIKYGAGVITDFDVDSKNQLNSKITVEFEEGVTKKFPMHIFKDEKFFTTDDEEIIPFVTELLEEVERQKAEAEKAKKEEQKATIAHCDKDESDKEVTIARWEAAKKVAGTHRFPHESRAVVKDNETVYINASSACVHLEARDKDSTKDGDKLYKAAEGKTSSYKGHKWRYATEDEIQGIIDALRKEEE